MVGETVFPLVRASDDLGVRSATLLVDGSPVATGTESPYGFSWTPGEEYAGDDVVLTAVVTDSAGHTTTSAPLTVSVAEEVIAATLRVAGVTKNKSAGTASIAVVANTSGTVTIKGRKIVNRTVPITGAGTVSLPVTPKKPGVKVLNKRGKLPLTVTLVLTPDTGDAVQVTRQLVLKKKGKK